MEFTSFAPVPIVDGHIHFVHPERLADIQKILSCVPCQRANLVCIPNPDASTHNPAALFFKTHFPDQVYISGALDYTSVLGGSDRAAELIASQVGVLKETGFDGLKMIEGKPQVRKLLDYPLDGWLYEPLWAELEREGFPVVFHVADPDNFWDPVECPGWAKESGWDYSDGTYPSKEDLYREVDRILERHPGLKIIFAHFYFLSADLDRAGSFLDAHPEVCFDLAPHFGMYADFSRDPEAARDFFIRFQDRIIYGSDIDTRVMERSPDGFGFMLSIPWLIRSFLEKESDFSLPGQVTTQGLGLPRDALEKIYHLNFERLYGENPRRLIRS